MNKELHTVFAQMRKQCKTAGQRKAYNDMLKAFTETKESPKK